MGENKTLDKLEPSDILSDVEDIYLQNGVVTLVLDDDVQISIKMSEHIIRHLTVVNKDAVDTTLLFKNKLVIMAHATNLHTYTTYHILFPNDHGHIDYDKVVEFFETYGKIITKEKV